MSTPIATQRATFTPVLSGAPQPTVAQEAETYEDSGTLDLVSPWPPEGFRDFRVTMQVLLSGTEAGEAVNAVLEDSWEIDGLGTMHGTFSYQGTPFERPHRSEVYWVGEDTAYAKYDGEWHRVRTLDEVEGVVGGMELQDFVWDVCGWRRQGDTEYEGRPVQHWTIATEDFSQCKGTAETHQFGDVASASGNVLFVAEDDYIVHLDLTLRGAQLRTRFADDGTLDEGRLEVRYDLSHANQPFSIEVPPEALAGMGRLNLDGFGDLDQATSYRAREQINLTGTAAAEYLEGALELFIEYTSEPRAQHLQTLVRYVNGSVETDDTYQIEGATYSKVGDVWQRRAKTEEIVARMPYFNTRELLEDTCGWKQQADVEHLGVLAHHWTMTKEDGLDCADPNFMRLGTVTGVSGDLIIAAENSYPLRVELIVEGRGFEALSTGGDLSLEEAQMVIVLEIWDVNQPFALEVPADVLAGKQVLNLEDLVDLNEMTSFRASTQVRIEGTAAGESLQGEVGYLIEFIAEPTAHHSQMSARGMHDQSKRITSDVYQLTDTTYKMVDGVWRREPTTEIWIDADWIDAHAWLEGTCGWEQQPDMLYEGILAHHWTMAAEDGLACPSDLRETGNLSGLSGNLFVAVDGNYILHLELVLEGTDLKGWPVPDGPVPEEGRVMIVLDMNDVNQAFAIQPPEEALSGETVP